MKPFYLTSILFISLGTALPVIHRDNNGILDDLLAIVKDATGIYLTSHDAGVKGIIGAVVTDGILNPILTDGLGNAEAVFDEVKSLLGIQDPRSLAEIIVSLEEAVILGGNETIDKIYQLLEMICGISQETAEAIGSFVDSIMPPNTSSSHSISLKLPCQLH
ncbi:hypothetical protein CI102_5623 [Trichoderma harzianum]|uniref:Uncharacterized protein n=1 Tax=Trichoderma harzianum CBS 226.95 TaxID=983964 RepID=A0A2T4AND5_TRIHA|nr:hypothetical protein M431DRAFT_477778 [Trichoderma harzianum CBS 226.95]PKK49886.1 hypothetical protein CI102_5623 [Trichoderma harzianum]PTB58577.1 hypothetical protein M431DRAFT_477778 [Trichoderma harzianum CBS 226.95]